MEELNIPDFNSQEEKIKFLVENKSTLMAQKKAQLKHADSVALMYFDTKDNAIKANNPYTPEGNEIKVKVVINTTNFLDSHDDVHFPKLWNKSLKENRMIMHLQEHKMAFDKIISDGKDLKAFVQDVDWKELGYKYEGKTQALIFDSTIKRDRNEFMFNQYAKGFVKNHSVGMQYIKMKLAVNNEGYENEYEVWEKYYDQIVNKEVADERGYFWAILEAKVIEGSAVPIGSNTATPTIDNNMKTEPDNSTQKEIEPSNDTQKINYEYLIKNLNIKN